MPNAGALALGSWAAALSAPMARITIAVRLVRVRMSVAPRRRGVEDHVESRRDTDDLPWRQRHASVGGGDRASHLHVHGLPQHRAELGLSEAHARARAQ